MDETAVTTKMPIPADQVDYLIATAARAPSVHNTQPWRFRASRYEIELVADPQRRLRQDDLGREMLISCGAALYGLRLGLRSLGFRPVVTLLPDQSSLRVLAKVSVVPGPPMTVLEHQMLEAVPHRHTHRDAFGPDPLPPGLVVGMQQDALAERAALAIVDRPLDYARLAKLISKTGPRLDDDPVARQEMLRWTRRIPGPSRDGVPARAFPAHPAQIPGRLRQRDFDLGRDVGIAELAGAGEPIVTAVLLTLGDHRVNWLHAGQALQRLLLRAASKWVFASLYSQQLESAPQFRRAITNALRLPGHPHLLLQFGCAPVTEPTKRRPPCDLLD